MKKYLLIGIACLFAGPVLAECPDGYVICKDGTKFTFGQKGWFSCTPIQSQKEAAYQQCNEHGGVDRGDEGLWQQNTPEKWAVLGQAVGGAALNTAQTVGDTAQKITPLVAAAATATA